MKLFIPETSGCEIEIHAKGIYIEQMRLFKHYCKVMINDDILILPIQMIKKIQGEKINES
jgi:hypothetical protein